jgi:hypothetical protein
LLSVLLGLALAPLVPAQTPPAANSLDPLVEQLGSNEFRLRQEAERRLRAEGARALPALRKGLGHPEAEVRRRARDLIPAIEIATLMAPARVSLKVHDKPLRAVFDEMTRQTGYKIEFWAKAPQQAYSFDFTNLTFWEALDRVCRTAHLALQPNYGGDEKRINLQPGDAMQAHVRYEGPFRLIPMYIQQTRSIAFNQPGLSPETPAGSESLVLSFQVWSEPRLPMLGVGAVKLDAAYDSEKNSMLPGPGTPAEMTDFRFGGPARWISRYGNGNRSLQMQTEVNLSRPSVKASSIKVLRASLPVTLLVEQKPVVLAEQVLRAKGRKVTVGSTTFHFEDVSTLPGKQYQLRLSITESNLEDPNDYTWMNTLWQRIELLDERGNKFQVSAGSCNSSPNHVQMTMTYGQFGPAKMGTPSRFVFHAWKTLQHRVDVEFHDLPLP